jgi:hypothetical protein
VPVPVHRSSTLVVAICAAAGVLFLAPSGIAQTPRSASDAGWCEDSGGSRDRERVCEVRELAPVAAPRLAIADNPNGAIQVSGGSRDDILVRARVVATAPTMDEARAIAGNVQVSLGADGRVSATGPRTDGRRSWWVSYRAEVPTRLDLELETTNGSVSVNGVAGRMRLETSNGSLTLADLGGDVQAHSSNGSVHVRLSGSRWDGDGLDVRTSNGSAQLDVPEDYNARLVTGTNNGSIRVDFPITVTGNIRRSLDTTLGSGGPTIRVQSSNGSVRVGRR